MPTKILRNITTRGLTRSPALQQVVAINISVALDGLHLANEGQPVFEIAIWALNRCDQSDIIGLRKALTVFKSLSRKFCGLLLDDAAPLFGWKKCLAVS